LHIRRSTREDETSCHPEGELCDRKDLGGRTFPAPRSCGSPRLPGGEEPQSRIQTIFRTRAPPPNSREDRGFVFG
jgi:hypothetical protein